MNRVIKAFGYFITRSTANRLAAIIGRLKRPRYLLGFVLAAAYLWYFLIRPMGTGRPGADAGPLLRLGIQGYYGMSLLAAWIFGAFGRGLIFRESEVELLFPAPLKRAHILFFKWTQAQFSLLITTLVFSVIIRRSLPDRSYLYLAPAIWCVGNALYIHTVFASLSLRSLAKRGGFYKNLVWLPGVVIGLVLFVAAWAAQDAIGGVVSLDDVNRVVEAEPLRSLLLPVHGLADFVLFEQGARFALYGAIILAAGLLLATLVVSADHRFEDQAIKTARMMSRLKSEGAAGLSDPDKQIMRGKGSTFPALAPIGPAWRALVWKNVISVGRLPKSFARLLIVAIPFFIFMIVFTRNAMSEGKGMAVAASILTVVAVYLSLLGPALLRVDLRLDIPHFDVLKSLPIRGRELLLGEVLGPCILVFLAQVLLISLAAFLFPEGILDWLDWRRRIIGVLTALPFLFAFDFALFSLENLMALHLPSFVRFGRGMKGGFDQFGQNLLGAIVRGLALAIMLLPSVLLGGGTAFLLRFTTNLSLELLIFIGVTIGAALLVAAAYLLIVLSESRYDRFDLSAESLSTDS